MLVRTVADIQLQMLSGARQQWEQMLTLMRTEVEQSVPIS